MFDFFNKKNKRKNDNNSSLSKITALLIHTAKIDENYTEKERGIIRKAVIELNAKDENIDEVLTKAEEIEKNSNQILEFTREVKNMSENEKETIVEALWKVIYSDNDADIYESNLMRRLSGLLYLDNKVVGKLKERIKKERDLPS